MEETKKDGSSLLSARPVGVLPSSELQVGRCTWGSSWGGPTCPERRVFGSHSGGTDARARAEPKRIPYPSKRHSQWRRECHHRAVRSEANNRNAGKARRQMVGTAPSPPPCNTPGSNSADLPAFAMISSVPRMSGQKAVNPPVRIPAGSAQPFYPINDLWSSAITPKPHRAISPPRCILLRRQWAWTMRLGAETMQA